MIHVMRTLPTQNVFSTFGQHAFKTHASHRSTYFIRINQAGVTKHFRSFTKHLFHLFALTHYLFTETVFIGQ